MSDDGSIISEAAFNYFKEGLQGRRSFGDWYVDQWMEHPYLTTFVHFAALAGITHWLNREDERYNQSTGQPADPRQNAILERQRQQAAELQNAAKRHQQRLEKIEEQLAVTGEILDMLAKNKDRLEMAVPGGGEDLALLRNIWKRLHEMSPQDRKREWEAVERLNKQAQDLEQEYLDFEQRWVDACTEWTQAWSAVNQAVELGRQFPLQAATAAGEETVLMDCDYWSHGALQRVADALPPLEQPQDTTLEQFSALMEQADRLAAQARDIMEQAGQAFLEKEARIQVSESILTQLKGRGWQATVYGFENEDEREKIILRLQSPSRDTLDFELNPDHTMRMRPQFQGVHNRNVMENLARVLQTALRQSGVTIEDISFA